MKFHFRSLPAKSKVFGISALLALVIVSATTSNQPTKVASRAQVAPVPPGSAVCIGSPCAADVDCHNLCGYKEVCANAGPVVPPVGGLCIPLICDLTTGVGKCALKGVGMPSPTPSPITTVLPTINPSIVMSPPPISMTPPTVSEAFFTPASFTPPVPPATTVKICLDYFKCSDSDAKIDGAVLNGKIPSTTVTAAPFISGKSICANVKDLAEYTLFGSGAKRAMMAHCASKIPLTPSIIPTKPPSFCKATNNCQTKSIGDANCDGVVTVVDFEIFRSEISGEKTSCEANFDGVNGVDMNDYRIWYLTVQGIK